MDLVNTIPKIQRRKPKQTIEDDTIKFKTELCKNWERGICNFGNRCKFAHGNQELKPKVIVSQNYKTQKCRQFHIEGYCVYGTRCQFIHNLMPKTASSTPPTSKCSSRDNSTKEIKLDKRLPIFQDIHRRFESDTETSESEGEI